MWGSLYEWAESTGRLCMGSISLVESVISLLLEDLESKLPSLLRKYPEFDEQKIRSLADQDPTPQKSYLEWLLVMVRRGSLTLDQALKGIPRQALEAFFKLTRMPFFKGEKDLYRYKTFQELKQVLHEYEGHVGKKEKKRQQTIRGIKKLASSGDLVLYEITTIEAATEVFRGTKWCVKDPDYSRKYLKAGSLYLITKNGKPYVCGDVGLENSWNDLDNYQISGTQIREISKVMAPVYDKIRSMPGNRAMAIYYARQKGWWPEETAVDEIRKALGNRAMAIRYAREAGWWPEETFVDDIRKASGNRAMAIYSARYYGWWPKGTFVDDIRKAPGDRAMAIYYARENGWWPEETFVDDIRKAPGNRAMAICYARENGWWPKETFVDDIRKAPGDRAMAIYYARLYGWWPEETFVDDIRKAPGDRAMAIYYARYYGWWPKETFVDDIRKASGDRARAIYYARLYGWWPD